MSKLTRANQGGVTVLGFIIVGVTLAIVTIGIVYTLYQRGELARRDQAIAVVEAQEKLARESTPPADVADDQPATSPAPSQPVSQPTPGSTELPATGPAQDITTGFMLAVLTASIIAYSMSRRIVRGTL